MKRICFWGQHHARHPWEVACGRYGYRVPLGAENYTTSIVTKDPREVTCHSCWRTRRWRDAMGLTGVKQRIKITRNNLTPLQTAGSR